MSGWIVKININNKLSKNNPIKEVSLKVRPKQILVKF